MAAVSLPRSLVQQIYTALRPPGYTSLGRSGTLDELLEARSFLFDSCLVSKHFRAALRPTVEKHLLVSSITEAETVATILEQQPGRAAKVRTASFFLQASFEDMAEMGAVYYHEREREADEEDAEGGGDDTDLAIDWSYNMAVTQLMPHLSRIIGACTAMTGVRFDDDVVLRHGWTPLFPTTCRFIRIPFSTWTGAPVFKLVGRHSQLSSAVFECGSGSSDDCSGAVTRLRTVRLYAGLEIRTATAAASLEELDVTPRQTDRAWLQAALGAAKKMEKLTLRIGQDGSMPGRDVAGLFGVLTRSIKMVRIASVDTGNTGQFVQQLSASLGTTKPFKLLLAASQADLDGAGAAISALRIACAARNLRLATAAI